VASLSCRKLPYGSAQECAERLSKLAANVVLLVDRNSLEEGLTKEVGQEFRRV